mgnify:CR=1 FL=1
MAKKIAIKIRQGGSGKTTTAVNLATALHMLGKHVLLVDLDSQANSTQSVGLDIKSLPLTLANILTDIGISSRQVITKTSFGLSVLPSHPSLSHIEMSMSLSKIGEIKKVLTEIENDYDFIIMDTPPSESFLVVAALVASDEVIIPMEAHFLPMFGLQKTIQEIEQIKSGLNPTLKIISILATKVEGHTNLAKSVLEEVKKNYPDLLFPMVIPKSVKVSEAPATGKPIVLSDPKHPASVAYMELAKLLISK